MEKINQQNTNTNPYTLKEGIMDLKSLILPQDFAAQQSAEKLLTTVPVRKPSKTDFFRVNPDDDYQLGPIGILELKEERETYLVSPEMTESLSSHVMRANLVTVINRQGVVFLWPLKLPRSDGRDNPWYQSAREAANLAKEDWVNIVANMSLGGYDIHKALGDLPEPEWPSQTLEELLDIAFRGFLIDRPDHAVVKQLQGLV
jgi:hypothetical protein